MRNYLQSFVLALLTCISYSVKSQTTSAVTWVGNNPVAGETFYLYNVGQGQWFCGANQWGTHISLTSIGGLDITLFQNGSGFSLDTKLQNSTNEHFLNGEWCDGSAQSWTFTPASQGYYINNGSGNLAYAGNGTNLAVRSDITDDNAKWILVTYEERIAALSYATAANPIDATFLIVDANFGRNDQRITAWSIEANNFNLSGGNNINNCAESWRSPFSLSQTLTVPNGRYQLRAQAALTEYNITGQNFPVVYLNNATVPFKVMQNGENSMSTMSSQFSDGKYFTDFTEIVNVVDNTINLGARGTRTDTWAIWDNFQLLYLGIEDDLSTYEKLLANAVARAQTTEGSIPAAAFAEITSVLNACDKTYETREEYNAAISAINEAVRTYASSSMVAAFTRYVSMRDAANTVRKTDLLEENEEGTFSKFDNTLSAIDNRLQASISVDEIDACIDDIRLALKTLLFGVNPQIGNPLDITLLLDNPNFEEGGEETMGKLPGWTCTFIKGETATNIGYQPNAYSANGVQAVDNSYVNGDVRICQFMEAWQQDSSPYVIGNGELFQRLSGLPIGKYRLVMDAIAVNQWNTSYNPVTGTYIYISSGQLETTTEIATGNGLPEHFEVDFINDHAESLDFGLKTINTTANWIAADNFRIYYVAALSESPGVAALKEALTDYDGVTFAACDASIIEAYNQEILHAKEMTLNDIYSAAHSSECIDEIVTLKEAYDAVCSSEKDYEVYQQEVNKILNRYLQLQDKESPLAYSLNAYASTLELSINEGNAVASDFQYMDEKIAYIEYYWSRHLLPEDINTLENVLTQLGEQPAWSKRWDLDTDELILDGVINTEGRVTAISLADRGLIGVVPPALMTLQKVSAIDLSGNSFSAIESEVPASISLNLHNQQLNAIVDYKVGTNDASVILAQLPSILCYDSSAGGQTSHFVFSSTGDGWGFTLSEDNGNLRFTGNTPFIFKEENGAVLQCHSSFGNASGSTFSLRLTFDDGDANFNGEVNIGDLQMMINYIFDDIANGSLFNFTAADLWKDNRINVQDVVKEVDVLFAQSDDEAPVKAMYEQQHQEQEDIHASLRFENGQLLLESDTPVTALDITLASDQSVSWQALQAMGFTVTTRNVSGGIRLIAYSMSGVEVPVGETAIATTTGSATVLKATLSDKTSNTIGVYLNSTIPTSINDIDEASLEGASVYDLGGRKVADKAAALRHLPKGIYVINGKKVIK